MSNFINQNTAVTCKNTKLVKNTSAKINPVKNYFKNNDKSGEISFPFGKKACLAMKNTTLAFAGYNYQLDTEEIIDSHAFGIGTKNIPLLRHSYATSLYTEELAKALGLKDKEISNLKIAAFVHDEGKLIQPESSFKTGSGMNNPPKYSLHSAIGKARLNKIREFKDNGIGMHVGHHHEKYDGSGFPDKLNYMRTSLTERLIPIADAFDSITVNKYQDSIPKTPLEAIENIESRKGTDFDPEAVDKFTEIISKDDFALFKKVQSQVYRKVEDFKLDYGLAEKIKPATNVRNLLNPLISGDDYRKMLADGMGVPVNSLKTVIGPDELQQEIKRMKPENFNPQNNGIFSINLHLHTIDSDGEFEAETLFNEVDKQVQRMRKDGNKEKFIVAVTDHDTVGALTKFLDFIAKETEKNPDRFKDISFVPGIEINSVYKNPKYLKKPVQLEILGYCVNPFDKKLTSMLKKIKDGNEKIINDIITDATQKYRINSVDFPDYKARRSALRIAGGPGIDDSLLDYLRPRNLKPEQIDELFKDRIPTRNSTVYTPDIETVLNATKGAMAGIAHPTRINFSDVLIKDMAINKGLNDKEVAMYRLFKDFAGLGGYASEANYQHDKLHSYAVDGFESIIKLAPEFNEKLDLLNAGGVDNHGTDLLKRY